MGGTKQRKPRRRGATPPPSSAEFTVVLEDLRSNFAVFGEALHGLAEMTERRFDEVDRRFEQVDRRFEQVDRRFEQVDRRFDQIDHRFDRVEGDVALLKSAVLDQARQTKALCASVDDLAAKIEKKPDRDEVAALVRQVVNERAH
jgi:septal ring factor EnvC (AmiA/AmiB activator)